MKVPASATTLGFVPPRLNTKDIAVVDPLVKADDKALVKVMTFPETLHPPGELLKGPVTLDKVQEA